MKLTPRGRTFDPVNVVLCLALLMLGASILSVGVLLESTDFWIRHPFLTNVASGVATACFGIPFAIVVLSRIYRRQAAITERQQLGQSIDREIGLLQDIFSRQATTVNDPKLTNALSGILKAHEEIETARYDLLRERLKLLKEIEADPFGGDRQARTPLLMAAASFEFKGRTEKALKALSEEQTRLANSLPSQETDSASWLSASTSWRILEESIRPRANDADVEIPKLATARTYLTKTYSPLRELIDVAFHKVPTYIEYWQLAKEDSTKLTGEDRIEDRTAVDFDVIQRARTALTEITADLNSARS
ncbi:hypothetical protein EV383_1450 [Pseudonocardia sediminis]|uniref:Uncharacterized protein n=1 Tax=Pseudonocardia sediminis TaxID=1397368 RepID=A0A4Q7UWQ1_PSEST|nr:hypothetical protein [Pseudonocardia sediminis]RZT84603.1 hypothetical protein EV383_1450 [Pseudonocardia sediminis]